MELDQIKKVAEEIVEKLRPHCLEGKIVIGGSIRRGKPYPNDIEIICLPKMRTPKTRSASWCNAAMSIGRLITGTSLNKNTYLQFRENTHNIKIDVFIPPVTDFDFFWTNVWLSKSGRVARSYDFAFRSNTLSEIPKNINFNSKGKIVDGKKVASRGFD